MNASHGWNFRMHKEGGDICGAHELNANIPCDGWGLFNTLSLVQGKLRNSWKKSDPPFTLDPTTSALKHHSDPSPIVWAARFPQGKIGLQKSTFPPAHKRARCPKQTAQGSCSSRKSWEPLWDTSTFPPVFPECPGTANRPGNASRSWHNETR